MSQEKINFEKQLKEFVRTFSRHVSTQDGQWTVKGFIDVFEKIYTISSLKDFVKYRKGDVKLIVPKRSKE